jgi:ketosteroid isomerase-like protein
MKNSIFLTPQAAENAFYDAFEKMDLKTMMTVWEANEAIVCIHPLGPRLEGLNSVRESWRQIFTSGTRLLFRVSNVYSLSQKHLAIRVVFENITVLGAEEQPAQPIIATNIYRRHEESWHMILHHASPGPADSSQKKPSGWVH